MKTVIKKVSCLLIVIGFFALFGIQGASAQTTTTLREQARPATCKEMGQVAVVVATGEKFQRICVPEAQERTLYNVRAICNHTEAVVSFENLSIGRHFTIYPEKCQVFDLDDGILYT